MPSTLFFLQIVPDVHAVSYQNEWQEWARQTLPEVTLFDLDNLSDGLTMQYAADLLGRSERVALVVEVKSATTSAGKLLPFLEKYLVHPRASVVWVGPEHSVVGRMLGLLPASQRLSTSDEEAGRSFLLSQLAS
jgi:hypothetical protein